MVPSPPNGKQGLSLRLHYLGHPRSQDIVIPLGKDMMSFSPSLKKRPRIYPLTKRNANYFLRLSPTGLEILQMFSKWLFNANSIPNIPEKSLILQFKACSVQDWMYLLFYSSYLPKIYYFLTLKCSQFHMSNFVKNENIYVNFYDTTAELSFNSTCKCRCQLNLKTWEFYLKQWFSDLFEYSSIIAKKPSEKEKEKEKEKEWGPPREEAGGLDIAKKPSETQKEKEKEEKWGAPWEEAGGLDIAKNDSLNLSRLSIEKRSVEIEEEKSSSG